MNSLFKSAAVTAAHGGLAAILSSTVLAAAVWPATAQMMCSAEEGRTVSATGLDLQTPDGQAMLMNRVRMAAQTVCLRDEERHPARNDAFVSCYQEALTRAEAQARRMIAAAGGRGRVASSGW